MTIHGQIVGNFAGFGGDTIFELTNGQVWQQATYQYKYYYAYRPKVVITPKGNGRYVMAVEGMNQVVEVTQVYLQTKGIIISDFNGFDYGNRYEFQNGQVWEQVESKYKYRYVHRPHAIVVNGINGNELKVEGIDDVTVKVRRI